MAGNTWRAPASASPGHFRVVSSLTERLLATPDRPLGALFVGPLPGAGWRHPYAKLAFADAAAGILICRRIARRIVGALSFRRPFPEALVALAGCLVAGTCALQEDSSNRHEGHVHCSRLLLPCPGQPRSYQLRYCQLLCHFAANALTISSWTMLTPQSGMI